jgi:hypothetical protein
MRLDVLLDLPLVRKFINFQRTGINYEVRKPLGFPRHPLEILDHFIGRDSASTYSAVSGPKPSRIVAASSLSITKFLNQNA